MASTFPGAIDSFTDPLSGSALNSPSHSAQHADLNDAAEKLETYMGLVKVIPTSVSSAGGTSATLGATGTITIGSANTSITVNGAFSSLYNSYKIIASGSVGSAQDAMVLTLGASATGYYYAVAGVFFSTGTFTTTGGLAASNTSAFNKAGSINTTGINFNVEVVNPFLATHTYATGSYIYNDRAGQFNGYHAVAASYSSFTINPASASMTGGSISIYGYRI